jgi:hypothetical protein
MPDAKCKSCGREFAARRRGGSRQAYCCSSHRTAFRPATRLWAERALAVGILTIADLRNGDPLGMHAIRERLKSGGNTVPARRVTGCLLKRARGHIEVTSNRLGPVPALIRFSLHMTPRASDACSSAPNLAPRPTLAISGPSQGLGRGSRAPTVSRREGGGPPWMLQEAAWMRVAWFKRVREQEAFRTEVLEDSTSPGVGCSRVRTSVFFGRPTRRPSSVTVRKMSLGLPPYHPHHPRFPRYGGAEQSAQHTKWGQCSNTKPAVL